MKGVGELLLRHGHNVHIAYGDLVIQRKVRRTIAIRRLIERANHHISTYKRMVITQRRRDMSEWERMVWFWYKYILK